MSMKIKVSYTDESEKEAILTVMKPLMGTFKVKKSTGTSPYKHLYFVPKKG